VLNYVINENISDYLAYYYLGNLFYDKKQYMAATKLWEKSRELNNTFPTVHRNLALSYYNKMGDAKQARVALEKAFELDTTDARVFLELDQLYKKLGMGPEERIANYNNYKDTFLKRDDLYIEYVTLLNFLGYYEKALEFIMQRKFHPWEGGEGKVTTQYTLSLVELAKVEYKKKEYNKAKEYLIRALSYPANLGEGKLEGTKDNHIYYYLGCIYEVLKEAEEAVKCFTLAALGEEEPAGMMYYNDQPADMILYQGLAKLKLGEKGHANARFYKLLDYGEKHIFDKMSVEYFAVSLPDFLIFNDDLDIRNQAHCQFLIGLGRLGLEDLEGAKTAFHKALESDQYHMGSVLQLNHMV
jgi:tetratricopeptide (TPR) repeat protein